MNRIHVEDFDLCSTLESGQIFRYVRLSEGYLVNHRRRAFWVCQKGQNLFFDGVEERCILHLFGLDRDYRAIMRSLGDDRTLKTAMRLHWGLRILRQDPWECLISFLCSSTKPIRHIRVIIERLCRAFGEEITFGNHQVYAFPGEGTISGSDRLRAIGLGFRARYIHEVNQIIEGGYLERVAAKPYGEAKALLMGLPGVGDKVADCVLLFSMECPEAFPIDTWIRRGMERSYFRGERTSAKKIHTFARKHFGPYAGYAQQLLYHYWREKGRNFDTKHDPSRRR